LIVYDPGVIPPFAEQRQPTRVIFVGKSPNRTPKAEEIKTSAGEQPNWAVVPGLIARSFLSSAGV
jgi:hypothetical protein